MTAGDLPPGYPFSFAEAVTARQRTKPGQPVDTIREQFQPRFFFSLISFGPRQFGRTPKNAFYTSSERAHTHTHTRSFGKTAAFDLYRGQSENTPQKQAKARKRGRPSFRILSNPAQSKLSDHLPFPDYLRKA